MVVLVVVVVVVVDVIIIVVVVVVVVVGGYRTLSNNMHIQIKTMRDKTTFYAGSY